MRRDPFLALTSSRSAMKVVRPRTCCLHCARRRFAFFSTFGIRPLACTGPSSASGISPSYWRGKALNICISRNGACRERSAPKLPRLGRANSIWRWYDENVVKPYFSRNLHWFLNMGNPLVMMCMEADPEECHRHRLFLELEKQGLRGFDL